MPITSKTDENSITGTTGTYNEVNTFAELPDPAVNTGALYYVNETTGIVLINRKLSGWYRSDGISWLYAGDLEIQAFEVGFTPDGDISSSNLQDAIAEVRTDTDTKLSTKVNTSSLALVATSGAYADLSGTPILSTVAITGAYTDLSGTPALATVATTGAYTDLTGTPALAAIALSGAYADLIGAPTLASVAISGNYNDLLNLPTLATVASSGSYNDLSNTPTLATVATSGLYTDLTGTPAFGTNFNFITDEVSGSTSSTTFVQKTRLNLTGIAAGDYYISVSVGLSSSANNRTAFLQIQIDDTTTIHSSQTSGTDVGQKGTLDIRTLTAGNHFIDVDYRVDNNSGSANIQPVRIFVWRIQ